MGVTPRETIWKLAVEKVDAEPPADVSRRLNIEAAPTAEELAEARRQYDEVYARYHNADGTPKPSWMKAPSGKPTNLTERQWVQVRTPNFKKWFGDWEAAYYSKGWRDRIDPAIIRSLPAIDISGYAPLADKSAISAAFEAFDVVTNKNDNLKVRFPANAAGRFVYQRKHVGAYKALFESAVRAWSESETKFEGHKEHNNIDSYHQYVNKFSNAAGEHYIRFTVREEKANSDDKNMVHGAQITGVEIYDGAEKENGSALPEFQTGRSEPSSEAKKPRIDYKLALFLNPVNPDAVSKVVDENGEPMVVWHGSNHTHTVFDNRKSEYRNGTPDGVTFLTDARSVAASYTPGERGEDVVLDENGRPFVDVRFKDGHVERQFYDLGGVYAIYLSLKNPMIVEASGAEWSRIPFEGKQRTTNEISEIARARGYDGVIFNGVVDGAMRNRPAPSKTFASFSPSQIKSATDNIGTFNASNPDIRFSIGNLFTGSAADYDKPALHYIGSGEGSQVYGWGLYASSVRGVADTYMRGGIVGKGAIRIDGRKVNAGEESAEGRLARRFAWQSDKGRTPTRDLVLEDARSELSERLEQIKENEKRGWNSDHIKKWVRELKEDIAILEDETKKFDWIEQGNLYEQTFFTNRATPEETERHLLKWYEPVSEEQRKWIRDAIWDLYVAHEFDADGKFPERADSGSTMGELSDKLEDGQPVGTGNVLYHEISTILGSPQAASEFLVRAGIDGVKYPVDSYGKTVKNGDEAGWNYVSFRDDNIRVDHKWADGQERYSIAGPAGAARLGTDTLDEAKNLRLNGASREEIWRRTGWYVGGDGKWAQDTGENRTAPPWNVNERWKIASLPNSGNVVIADEYTGPNDPKSIEKFLRNSPETIATIMETGLPVLIGPRLSTEYARSGYSKILSSKQPSKWDAKASFSPSIKEMVENATNRRWEKEKHPHKKHPERFKYGFYRYDSRVAVGDGNGGHSVYDVELVINNHKNGKHYLYDIVNLKENKAATAELQQENLRSIGSKTASIQSSMPQNAGNVKGENSPDEKERAKLAVAPQSAPQYGAASYVTAVMASDILAGRRRAPAEYQQLVDALVPERDRLPLADFMAEARDSLNSEAARRAKALIDAGSPGPAVSELAKQAELSRAGDMMAAVASGMRGGAKFGIRGEDAAKRAWNAMKFGRASVGGLEEAEQGLGLGLTGLAEASLAAPGAESAADYEARKAEADAEAAERLRKREEERKERERQRAEAGTQDPEAVKAENERIAREEAARIEREQAEAEPRLAGFLADFQAKLRSGELFSDLDGPRANDPKAGEGEKAAAQENAAITTLAFSRYGKNAKATPER